MSGKTVISWALVFAIGLAASFLANPGLAAGTHGVGGIAAVGRTGAMHPGSAMTRGARTRVAHRRQTRRRRRDLRRGGASLPWSPRRSHEAATTAGCNRNFNRRPNRAPQTRRSMPKAAKTSPQAAGTAHASSVTATDSSGQAPSGVGLTSTAAGQPPCPGNCPTRGGSNPALVPNVLGAVGVGVGIGIGSRIGNGSDGGGVTTVPDGTASGPVYTSSEVPVASPTAPSGAGEFVAAEQ